MPAHTSVAKDRQGTTYRHLATLKKGIYTKRQSLSVVPLCRTLPAFASVGALDIG